MLLQSIINSKTHSFCLGRAQYVPDQVQLDCDVLHYVATATRTEQSVGKCPGPPKMVFSCTFCTYCCNVRLDVIKHLFSSHSVEATFNFVCGIKGCLHSFKYGSTFSSFKTHANRKHPNWQDCVNDAEAMPPLLPVLPSLSVPLLNSEPDLTANDDLTEPVSNDMVDVSNAELRPCPSTQRTAALFLLTFQEKYKLSQRAINFATGTINTIVDGVCESLRDSLQESGSSPTDIAACIDQREDPFAHLQTEYMQSKVYRDEFGLVVSVCIIS